VFYEVVFDGLFICFLLITFYLETITGRRQLKKFQVNSIVSINKFGTVTFTVLSLLVSKEPTRHFQSNPIICTLHLLLLRLRFLPKRRNIVMF
jgi:hypothetical protein